MGYVVKTTFWLGLVLTSMPLGEPPKVSDILSPAEQAAMCSAASRALTADAGDVYRGMAAIGCAKLLSAPAAAPSHDLTANDRKPPWLGAAGRPKLG